MRRERLAILLRWKTYLLALWIMLLLPAFGQAAPPFYEGKTITIYAGYSPGGGIDTNMRAVARHISKHIPGNPQMIPKNMPGAGGSVNANFLYNKADPDGLTIGMPGRTYPLSPLLGEPGAKFDPLKFSFIGSPGEDVHVFWIRSAAGISSIDDLKKSKKEIIMGALTRKSTGSSVPSILKKYMGWRFRVLGGYKATAAIMLAMEQGEVDGAVLPLATVVANRPDLVRSKFFLPIFQTSASLPNVPVIWDLIPKKARPLLNLALAANRWGVPLIGPPGIPAERLTILRNAFMEMAEKDEGFKKDALKLHIAEGNPISGEELEKLTREIIESANEEVVAEFKALIGEK
jgi:hypothetical protein